jgi:hypothetical protein
VVEKSCGGRWVLDWEAFAGTKGSMFLRSGVELHLWYAGWGVDGDVRDADYWFVG